MSNVNAEALRNRLLLGRENNWCDQEVREALISEILSPTISDESQSSRFVFERLLESQFGMMFCELAVRLEEESGIPTIMEPDQRYRGEAVKSLSERRLRGLQDEALKRAMDDRDADPDLNEEIQNVASSGVLVRDLLKEIWDQAFREASRVADDYFYGAPNKYFPFSQYGPSDDETFDYPNFGRLYSFRWMWVAFAHFSLSKEPGSQVPLTWHVIDCERAGRRRTLRGALNEAIDNASRYLANCRYRTEISDLAIFKDLLASYLIESYTYRVDPREHAFARLRGRPRNTKPGEIPDTYLVSEHGFIGRLLKLPDRREQAYSTAFDNLGRLCWLPAINPGAARAALLKCEEVGIEVPHLAFAMVDEWINQGKALIGRY